VYLNQFQTNVCCCGSLKSLDAVVVSRQSCLVTNTDLFLINRCYSYRMIRAHSSSSVQINNSPDRNKQPASIPHRIDHNRVWYPTITQGRSYQPTKGWRRRWFKRKRKHQDLLFSHRSCQQIFGPSCHAPLKHGDRAGSIQAIVCCLLPLLANRCGSSRIGS